MAPPDHKRMRLDTSCTSNTSRIQTNFTVKILDNRAEKIIELSNETYEPVDLASVASTYDIENMVQQAYFQDNTMAFKTILSTGGIILIIYPPGSGKTTMALLLESYLSSTIECSDKLTTFFQTCEFAKECKSDYDEFYKSGSVAYINFEGIRGTDRVSFEKSLVEIMLTSFKKYFSADVVQDAAMLMNPPEDVYISMMQFVQYLRMVGEKKKTYLILDSCDTVYNTIAQLGAEAAIVCKQFTEFLKSAVHTGSTDVMLICFGVSPYFAYEFAGQATIYNVHKEANDLGKYFSYSEETRSMKL
ncbi:uncharacterized protein LOC135839534 [Planococcus citri]|uniref:uncharacterized protein LOC135839534 n=1 Tax=Planococcus citri TaxID=170843 RepID=UPI0031F7EADB